MVGSVATAKSLEPQNEVPWDGVTDPLINNS